MRLTETIVTIETTFISFQNDTTGSSYITPIIDRSSFTTFNTVPKSSLITLQNRKIAKEFAVYYDLFIKYKEDYQVDRILAGEAGSVIKDRVKEAKFDERLSLVGLLLDAVNEDIRGVIEEEDLLRSCMDFLHTG